MPAWAWLAIAALMLAPTAWTQPVYGAYGTWGGYGGASAGAYGGTFLQDGLACQCNSTSRPPRDPRDPVPSKVYLSANPSLIANWTSALNPHLPKDVSFVCTCKAVPTSAKAENYILNANQTDPTAKPAAECLGEAIMNTICAGLQDLALFTCDTVWRDGVAGKTSDNLVRNDAILEAVHKLCAAEGGACAQTIEFTDLLDELLPPPF